MKKVIATVSVVGLASLAFQTTDAAVLNGTISKTANTCPAAIATNNGDDCSYNDSYTQTGGDPWVGPDRSSGFYASSLAVNNPTTDWAREPTPGDGKVSPSLTANLTIGAGNMVSGTIVIGPVAFNNFSAGPSGRGEDSWTSATITLVAKAADSVVGNTLIIGSAGFPPYLQASNASDQFPSETAADSNASPTADTLWWAGPGTIGITVMEGNTGTTGTMGVANFVGYSCNDQNGIPNDGACGQSSSFQDRGNFENILLKIKTDGAGNAAAVEGFLVQNPAGAFPNWVAWTFSALADTDNDGAPDIADNCRAAANNGAGGTGAQCDTDGDGFGNRCDGDFISPAPGNGVTNAQDYSFFRARLGTTTTPTYDVADLTCNGTVNAQDYSVFRSQLGLPPGPGAVP